MPSRTSMTDLGPVLCAGKIIIIIITIIIIIKKVAASINRDTIFFAPRNSLEARAHVPAHSSSKTTVELEDGELVEDSGVGRLWQLGVWGDLFGCRGVDFVPVAVTSGERERLRGGISNSFSGRERNRAMLTAFRPLRAQPGSG